MKRLMLILAMLLCLVAAPACSSNSGDSGDEAENVEAEESDDEESDDEESDDDEASDDEESDDEESDDEASDDEEKDDEESDDEEADDETAKKDDEEKDDEESDDETAKKDDEEKVDLEPGKVPFEFPAVGKLSAEAGDYVLTPSRSVLEQYAKEGKGVSIYYTSKIVEVGDKETKVKSLAGTEYSMPNAMIIPLRKEEKVAKGDVVLTWWQSGSGMQRAIVTGGSATEPTVRYLDLKTNSDKEDTLKPNSFHKLTTPMEVGSTVACKDGSRHSRWVVTAAAEDKLLLVGFAGKMAAMAKYDCVGLPLALDASKIKKGAKVQAPFVGSYREATVARVDAATGRVYITFEGQTKEQDVAFIDVTSSLDGSAPAVAEETKTDDSTTTAKAGEIDVTKVKKDDPKIGYGNFRGSLSGGGVSGSIMLSIKPGKLSGNMKGTRNGEKWNTGVSGSARGATFSGSGVNKTTSLRVSGKIVGRTASGTVTGRINGKSASMRFSANR